MIIDGRTLSDGATVDADVCVMGAGAAGITLATELNDGAARVVLLESGGLSPDPVTQSLYAGENVGIAYERLDRARSRFFGGSTSCWGGWCRPLDPLDFEERPWMPNSGWPFERSALDSYYARAAKYLRLSLEYDTGAWSEQLRFENISFLPIEGDVLHSMMIQISSPGTFGPMHKEDLERSSAVKVILYSNVVKLDTCENTKVIESVRAKTLTGLGFSVRARYFVLCLGGVENARLLLLSNDRRPNGLGNDHDVVGRYFMDHPRFKSGRLRLKGENRYRPLYDVTMAMKGQIGRKEKTHGVAAHLAPTARAQRDLKLPNSRSYFEARYAAHTSRGYLWLRAMRRQWRGRRVFGYSRMSLLGEVVEGLPAALSSAPLALLGALDLYTNLPFIEREFQFESVIEPAPNPESRVTLSHKRDRLGLLQTRLDWRLTKQTYAAAKRLKGLLRDELHRQGVITPVDSDEEDDSEATVVGCWHHMGTTRMHKDPCKGVVDENLKVHGVENLFIGGSSVFPTVGSDCPTITLVALSIRLAAHLRQVMVLQLNL
jgi:choline dehydrogenase-like flavoprotein